MQIDKNDAAILNELVKNARMSFNKLAKRAKLATGTVIKRVQALEEKGVIRKYSAIFDYPKMGYEFEAIVTVKVSKGKLFEVERKIAVNPNVCAVYDVTGPWDVVVLVRHRNRQAFDAFIKKIQTYDFIERTETQIILNTLKEEQVKF